MIHICKISRNFASSPTWCNLNRTRLPIPPYLHVLSYFYTAESAEAEHLASSTSVIISNADENVNTSVKIFSELYVRFAHPPTQRKTYVLMPRRIVPQKETDAEESRGQSAQIPTRIRIHAPETGRGQFSSLYAKKVFDMPQLSLSITLSGSMVRLPERISMCTCGSSSFSQGICPTVPMVSPVLSCCPFSTISCESKPQ